MHLVKKVALVFLASGFLVGSLAGCGGEKPKEGAAPAKPAEPAKPETK